MHGKYHIVIQNSRIKFEFDIKRNITIIRGDSATGKTTLIQMLEAYVRLGEESGITVTCSVPCRTFDNSNWDYITSVYNENILFADEDTSIIKTEEFARTVKGNKNYFVLVTRENLPNLPYSVDEIYGIHVSGKYAGIRQVYNTFYNIL